MAGTVAGFGVLFIVLLLNGLSEGVRPLSLGRIVGGEDAVDGQVPYIMALYTVNYDNTVSLLCGASIYNQNTVITAAHCVMYRTPTTLCVRYGLTDISQITTRSQCLGITNITMHPNYDDWSLVNDIALLKLRYNLAFGPRVQPVSLPSANCGCPPGGTAVVICGWGSRSEGSGQVSLILQVATVYVVDRGSCAITYSDYGGIQSTQLCAADINKDTCQGDSGGPLLIGNVLIGITSWGVGCARAGYPGVYICVCKYILWIRENA